MSGSGADRLPSAVVWQYGNPLERADVAINKPHEPFRTAFLQSPNVTGCPVPGGRRPDAVGSEPKLTDSNAYSYAGRKQQCLAALENNPIGWFRHACLS
jgi:hypothetical protein